MPNNFANRFEAYLTKYRILYNRLIDAQCKRLKFYQGRLLQQWHVEDSCYLAIKWYAWNERVMRRAYNV